MNEKIELLIIKQNLINIYLVHDLIKIENFITLCHLLSKIFIIFLI